MLVFVPLHVTAVDASPSLDTWIQSWLFRDIEGVYVAMAHMLKTEEWFTKGHDISGYTANIDGMEEPILKLDILTWFTPCITIISVEELRKFMHKG